MPIKIKRKKTKISKENAYELYKGDMLAWLDDEQEFPDNSISAVVTDPPYNLSSNSRYKPGAAPARGTHPQYQRLSRGFMQAEWDGTQVAFFPETWEKIYRVMKPGAYMVAFGGRRTFHRMVTAIEDAGFLIRDMIMWVYFSGMPKSQNFPLDIDRLLGVESDVIHNRKQTGAKFKHAARLIDNKGYNDPNRKEYAVKIPTSPEAKLWDGYGTDLKPAFEPIILVQKPLESSYGRNALKHGVGGLNINATRVIRDNKKPGWHKTGADTPKGYLGASTFRSRNMSSQEILTRTGGNANWPTNLLISSCPACNLTGQILAKEYLHVIHHYDNISLEGYECMPSLLYVPKPSKKERDAGLDHLETKMVHRHGHGNNEPDDVTQRYVTHHKNPHPTIKPLMLKRYLCRLICPSGGIILDPFAGSFTTGTACIKEGFQFKGIEKNEEFFEVGKERMAYHFNKQLEVYEWAESLGYVLDHEKLQR